MMIAMMMMINDGAIKIIVFWAEPNLLNSERLKKNEGAQTLTKK